MKKSKLLSLIMAFAMILTMVLPLTASAADLVISGPDSLLLDADDFAAYKIFSITNVTGDPGEENITYAPTAAVAPFLVWAVSAPHYSYGSPYGATFDEFRLILADEDDNSEFLNQLTADLMEYNETATTKFAKIADATLDDGKVTFTDLDDGYYLITGKGKGDGKEKVTAHSSLVSVFGDDEFFITLKADSPSINKEVWNHNEGLAGGYLEMDDEGWTDWTDENMGDYVYFRHTSVVPNMFGYKAYAFTVKDLMSKGLTFNGDVKVEINGDVYSEYTVTFENPIMDANILALAIDDYVDATYIVITFDPAQFVELEEGDEIIITYSAELNEDAVIGAPGNPNKVWLEYSNDPYSTGIGEPGSTTETPEEEVFVYTFDLEILKLDGGDETTPLPGAEFELYKGTVAAGIKIGFIELDSDPDGYTYRLPTSDDDTNDIIHILVTDEDGIIKIKGLDAGEYEMLETKAPEGYNLVAGFITYIKITHEDNEGKYSVSVKEAPTDSYIKLDAKVVTILNNAGGILPGTGGIGTAIFYIVGIALAGALAAAYIVRKKRNVLQIN